MVVLRSQKAGLDGKTPSKALSKILESESVITVNPHKRSKQTLTFPSPRCASAPSAVVYHRRSPRLASKLNPTMVGPPIECKGFVEEIGKVRTVKIFSELVTEEGCDSNGQGVGVFDIKKGMGRAKEGMDTPVEQGNHAVNVRGKGTLNVVFGTELGIGNERENVAKKLKTVRDCCGHSDSERGMEDKDLREDTKLGDESGDCGLAEELKNEQTLGGCSSIETSDTTIGVDLTSVQNDDVECNQRKLGVERGNGNKAVIVDDNPNSVEELAKEMMIQENTQVHNRFSTKQKGKSKLDEPFLVSNHNALDLNVEFVETGSIDNVAPAVRVSAPLKYERQAPEIRIVRISSVKPEIRKRFLDVARKNAHRFAHFDPQIERNNSSAANASMEAEAPSEQAKQDVEDWPGPFSTAMKIMRDRASNVDNQHMSSSDKSKSVPLIWKPQHKNDSQSVTILVPSLYELSMAILVKNVEAISSLEGIPDELRNKLSHCLCDSRKMTREFMELLFIGSPTEVRVWDCSWLTEEQFPIVFKGCDTQNLTVLQLDLCGQCMPDYILQSTLAQSAHSLPALTTVSLKGAYRLSDVGLKSLCNSSPQLKSINLTHCSFLTSTCIEILADSLESVLNELIIDECDNIDAMRILPALSTFENLEILSVAGIQTVCDDFIQKFISVRGPNLKKLILSDCVSLTDSSLKVLSEKCSRLYSLDLVNLNKLTDSALGYLANGCCVIQKLKLCRNPFSDEALAAFVETCGQPLIELSLNNVIQIGSNTAVSLAKHSKNLVSLDLSWCRNLTDEAVGIIVDGCSSLRYLRLFGCTQITNVFLNGHSNLHLKILGMKLTPVLDHPWEDPHPW